MVFVDTSMWVLNVRLDEHAFDAELYADELGLPPDCTLPASINPEDVRGACFFRSELLEFWHQRDIMFLWTVYLGKWVLRNLFLGFIREEEEAHMRRMRAVAATSPRTTGNHPATAIPPPPPHSLQSNRPPLLAPLMWLRTRALIPRVRAPSLSLRVIFSPRLRPASLWDSGFLRYHHCHKYSSPQVWQLLLFPPHNPSAPATSRPLKLHNLSRALAVVLQRPTQRQRRTSLHRKMMFLLPRVEPLFRAAAGLELLLLLLCQPHPMKADPARARTLVWELALVLQLGMVVT